MPKFRKGFAGTKRAKGHGSRGEFNQIAGGKILRRDEARAGGRQRKEVGSQRSEVRGQKSEVRGQRSEVRVKPSQGWSNQLDGGRESGEWSLWIGNRRIYLESHLWEGEFAKPNAKPRFHQARARLM